MSLDLDNLPLQELIKLQEEVGRVLARRFQRDKSLVFTDVVDSTGAFVRHGTKPLAKLELKERVQHVIGSLRRYLPDDFPATLEIVVRAGARWEPPKRDDKLGGLAAWPLIDFVGEYGLEHFDSSLAALRQLTELFSAEFAIRPFIEQDPKKALAQLRRWTKDPNEHVRRLVSEGTRPRLPWGCRLRCFQADPTGPLELLEYLKDDPSEVVRRSVANHLNDIAKDHPARVVAVAKRWQKGANENRQKIIRHALRTLVKDGHPQALKLLGYDPNAKVEVSKLVLCPKRLSLGDDLRLQCELHNPNARKTLSLVIDYAVHHVKKSGQRTAKVFKLKTCQLPAQQRLAIDKVHKLRIITTRKYHRGRHKVELLVNGRVRASGEFVLVI